MIKTPEKMSASELVNEFRESMLKLGKDSTDRPLQRRADQLEEEILRRMAW